MTQHHTLKGKNKSHTFQLRIRIQLTLFWRSNFSWVTLHVSSTLVCQLLLFNRNVNDEESSLGFGVKEMGISSVSSKWRHMDQTRRDEFLLRPTFSRYSQTWVNPPCTNLLPFLNTFLTKPLQLNYWLSFYEVFQSARLLLVAQLKQTTTKTVSRWYRCQRNVHLW